MVSAKELQPLPGSSIRVVAEKEPETVHFILGRSPLRYASHLAPIALGLFAIWQLAQADARHAAWIRSLPPSSRESFERHPTSWLQGPLPAFILIFFFALPLALFLIPALSRRHLRFGAGRVESFVRLFGGTWGRRSLPVAGVEKISTRASREVTVRVMGIKMPSPKGDDIVLSGPDGEVCFGGELPRAEREWLLAAVCRLLGRETDG